MYDCACFHLYYLHFYCIATFAHIYYTLTYLLTYLPTYLLVYLLGLSRKL